MPTGSDVYRSIPKDPAKNLDFRSWIVREGSTSLSTRRGILKLCADDLLFWINAFAWTYVPSNPDETTLPFITWPFQDDVLTAVEKALGRHDLLIEKSREMGGSWLTLTVFAHRFLFRPRQSFLLVSRKEDLVDKRDDLDALMPKIDFLFEHLPKWMWHPDWLDRRMLHMGNKRTRSIIDGDSTTGDVGRGGRRLGILLDEFAKVDNGYDILAATRDASPCRLLVSTPNGIGNAFHTKASDGTTKKIRLHWTQHPWKSIGLYHDQKGRPRSPWYDLQCRRAAGPWEIAQELDVDYLASDFQFFDSEQLSRVEKLDARPPLWSGEIVTADLRDPSVREGGDGSLKLWVMPGMDGKRAGHPKDRFVIGVDTAAGTGSSNSICSIANKMTGEKIGEYASPWVSPDRLAEIAVALCWWFCDVNREPAFLIWETGGAGRIFGNRVVDLGFRNIFYRRKDEKITKDVTMVPGWYATRNTKYELVGEYKRALFCGEFVNHSAASFAECREIVYRTGGWVEHVRESTDIDPSGAGENHGDRVTADAVCWRGMREVGKVQEAAKSDLIEFHTFSGRREARRRKLAESESAWQSH